jgi:DNA modification methylase
MSDRWAVHHGDCREVMQAMEPESIDSIVSDPPYGLSFMGKGWDTYNTDRKQRQNNKFEDFMYEVFGHALRVAKPGAHLLAFGGTRTFHRLTVAIEDAGWDIRDCVMWVYAQGFPKSLDVSKAIDKAAGVEREVTGTRMGDVGIQGGNFSNATQRGVIEQRDIPATPEAAKWSGWGTALKPAYEPIIVARKPLSGTVAENVLEWGTGGINVDGCRVKFAGEADESEAKTKNQHADFGSGPMTNQVFGKYSRDRDNYEPTGRWPANLIHDGSEEVTGLLGEAARFFYCPKASKRDRDEGCEGMPVVDCGTYAQDEWTRQNMGGFAQKRRNHHPTVKPTDLMRYLCRLVTPPDGWVLDPFTGSGSTGKAAMLEGFRFVGAEQYPEYIEIARARIGHAAGKTRQKELALA